MDILKAGVSWRWQTIPEYMDAVEAKLGVNVGMMIGHSAVRLCDGRSESGKSGDGGGVGGDARSGEGRFGSRGVRVIDLAQHESF